MQFDKSQAFDSLAIQMLPNLHQSIIDFIHDDSLPLEKVHDLFEPLTDEELALASAVIGSFLRWGYGEHELIALLRAERVARAPVVGRHPALTDVLGEGLVKRIDSYLELKRLAVGRTMKAKWQFIVSSGVLQVEFSDTRNPSAFPVASATRVDLGKARAVVAAHVMKNGLPESESARLSIAQQIAGECSPTVCGGWLNLGLYMVSSWELARRDIVRETGDALSLPAHKAVDDESIVDCYGFIFDLGPFRIERITQVNHKYIGADENALKHGQHIFQMGKEHQAAATKLKVRIEPALAGCGICGGAYKEHTHDRVLVISMSRDATPEEVEKHLGQLDTPMAADDIDGFVFVDSKEHFRIKPAEKNEGGSLKINAQPDKPVEVSITLPKRDA